MNKENDSLLLKWGTLKGWSLHTEAAMTALNALHKLGLSMSAMTQTRDDAHKKAVCDLIDALGDSFEIQNDWSGESYTKDQAKQYIMQYDI